MHLGFFANTRRIHQKEIMTELVVAGKDAVTCSARQRSHNIAFFANQRINERGFTSIGTSHNCKTR